MPDGGPGRVFDDRPCLGCGGRVELISGVCESCEARHLRPLPGPQTDFLACEADIALLGGGMGSGKTRSMLLDWLRHTTTPKANGLIVRNRLTDINSPGGLWDQALALFAGTAGVGANGVPMNPHARAGNMMDITWPSGAKLGFRHLDDRNVERFKGPEFSWIGVEEANECAMETIMWLFLARGRTTSGAKPVLRMTCNPDPDHTLAEWIEPYLILDPHDPAYGTPDRSKSGMILHVVRSRQTNRFELDADLAALAERTGQEPESALTFAYIPALLGDNKALKVASPDYERNLASMDNVERERNLDGNWKARRQDGGMLRPAWWGHLNPSRGQMFKAPIVRRVRAWDLAATKPKRPDDDKPDYTIGVRMEWDYHGRWYITDVVACRENTPEVDKLLAATAQADYAYSPDLVHVLEVEGGASGKRDVPTLIKVLKSGCPCTVISVPARKNKAAKARAMARELQLGMDGNKPREVDPDPNEPGSEHQPRGFIVHNGWTTRAYMDAGPHPPTLGALFWQQVTPFFDPKAPHDDIPDAMAIGHNAGSVKPAPKPEHPAARYRRLS